MNSQGLKKFLLHWARILRPVYLMASVGPDFIFPPQHDDVEANEILNVLFEVATELSLPFAFKVGV